MGALARTTHDAETTEAHMLLAVALPTSNNTRRKPGLALWMERVLEECANTGVDLAPDPVHDLRVALRRCRSMADGLRVMDPHPAWKEMKRAGKKLFSELGDLRDVHVMEEWVHRLGDPEDSATRTLLQFLASREAELKQHAFVALQEFDRKQWKRWIGILPRRAAKIRIGSAVFKHLALERWTEAYELHRRALRNRSQLSFHQLRIGLKRFRYIVENFLPEQHAAWSHDLKELQDLLGEVHDLDVLWATALHVKAFPDAQSRSGWHSRIIEERTHRIERYRGQMLGKASLWQVWRAELPVGKQIESAALSRLKLWASFLDPDFKHSTHVASLALQLYDGLQRPGNSDHRSILQVAALLHDVGRSRKEKAHHKETYDLIRKLAPPFSWNQEKLHWVGIVSRYHRGALPRVGQKTLRGLTPGQLEDVTLLAGILRLANAFDSDRKGRIQHLEVHDHNGFLTIAAQGYSARDRMAEEIAAARHLLETVSRRPVMVKPARLGTKLGTGNRQLRTAH
jgi:exopolyphosphatase/guanosine-5'-triphosphate,3'-diphosphate pyrophosphatase